MSKVGILTSPHFNIKSLSLGRGVSVFCLSMDLLISSPIHLLVPLQTLSQNTGRPNHHNLGVKKRKKEKIPCVTVYVGSRGLERRLGGELRTNSEIIFSVAPVIHLSPQTPKHRALLPLSADTARLVIGGNFPLS